MQVDIIRAQHAHLREALAALIAPDAPAAERAARAVTAVERAFHDQVPVWAEREVGIIRALVGGSRGGESTTARLSAADLERVATACLDLYGVACREYWTA